ncbi:MAG: Dabb family protein [Vicinamibacterales bacterium]
MTAHVVLLRPKPDLSSADREALLGAMRVAFTSIAEIRRVRVGKRKLVGRGYEAQMTTDFEFVCVIEFDDDAALKTYLDHPAHAELGKLFFMSADAALVYDYEMVEPARIGDLL